MSKGSGDAPDDRTSEQIGIGELASLGTDIEAKIDTRLDLPETGAWPAVRHHLDRKSAYAILAARAAGRPLLVRGEPGVGKSQLARAAAALLDRPFLAQVIQPDSTYQDLLWSLDHTARLADAQLREDPERVRNPANYIGPGALWWALNWNTASAQAKDCRHNYRPPEDVMKDRDRFLKNGCVLLIDEIDKADIALANGLLEVLGNRRFAVPPLGCTVSSDVHPSPLVVMTSNDSRSLPPALLRRCVVLVIKLPEDLQAHLVALGKTHFQDLDDEVLNLAAEQIIQDRKACAETAHTGLAEYLDLLGALCQVAGEPLEQLDWLDRLGRYFHKSHADTH